MSKETRAALEEALKAHFLDEAEEALIFTDWVVFAASQGVDAESTHYHYSVPEGMAPHNLTGLGQHMVDKFRSAYANSGIGHD